MVVYALRVWYNRSCIMKYAIVKSGGKQYKVAAGDVLGLEHITGEKDQKITLDEVLLYINDSDVKVGKPLVTGVSIDAVILEQYRGDKIRVAKFKAKTRYRRVVGHRQNLTKVKIESINESDGKKPKKVANNTI